MTTKLIWDVPTRLFHWLLVLSIAAQYVTAELLENAMQWHFYFGYFTLGLVLFRIVWGVAGTRYARFSQFLSGPGNVARYAKSLTHKNTSVDAGHNPLGGWSVIAMLLLISAQGVSGLFMSDDIFLDGPYRHLVDDSVQNFANTVHHSGFDILLGIIALHIVAIGYYGLYKRQQLIPAMIHGKKKTTSPGIRSSRILLALIIAVVCAAIVYYAVMIAPPEPVTESLYY